ncbi:MAG TPA: hypothetical protein VNB94_10750 [Mycobacteriales bacterium]|nr:hypothetical protein [Mycobacteriales bacterium]
MDDHVTDATGGISRRSAVKKIAAGTAVAWGAPALLTLQPAHAQGSQPCANCPPAGPRENPCDPIANEPQCGDSGPFNRCSCLRDLEGNCFCHEFVDCGDPRTAPGPNNTCPPGWRAAYACCDGQRIRCYPPCGYNHHQNP